MARSSHRLDSSVPEPAAGAAARAAAQNALSLCTDAAADGPAALNDRELNTALDPLRLFPALGVRCGHCEHGLGYVALNTQGATLVSGNTRRPPKRRRGGVHDLGTITDPAVASRGVMGWQADAQAGVGAVTPTGERPQSHTGVPQRRTHGCAKCHANYTHNNTTLLRMYFEAIARGDNEIRL